MAVDILLKIDGVKGESKIKGHENEIDVLAWNWGMSQPGSLHVGGGGGSGKIGIQDISMTKFVDKSSPHLIRACCNGAHLQEAVLTVRKSGETPLDHITITMSPVLVTSVSTGGGCGDDRPTENVSLKFGKFKFTYTPQKPDGTGDAAIDLVWNIEKNTEEKQTGRLRPRNT